MRSSLTQVLTADAAILLLDSILSCNLRVIDSFIATWSAESIESACQEQLMAAGAQHQIQCGQDVGAAGTPCGACCGREDHQALPAGAEL